MQSDERLQEAIAAHRSGDLATAQDIYIEILEENPEDPDGLHFLGLLHFDAGHPDSAIGLIQRSLEINESNTSALNNLGNILKLTGEPKMALAAYVQAVEYEPRHPDAWKNINVLLRNTGDYEGLLTIMSEIVRLDPENPEAWHTYGLANLFLGRNEEAADAINKALEFDTPTSPIAVWRARILAAEGRDDLALKHLERIVEADPDNKAAQYHLAAVRGDELEGAPEDYVAGHFDKFAASFDEVLENLGYRAPELVAEDVVALAEKETAKFQDVVDLGCGTGLVRSAHPGPLHQSDGCRPVDGDDAEGGGKLNAYDFPRRRRTRFVPEL